MTLRSFFKETADAIREVEGSSELIPAPEFPERIRHLSGAIDFTRLAKAISDANELKESTKVKGEGDYEFGTNVTTQDAVDAMTAAIAKGQSAYDSYKTEPVTQSILDNAQRELEASVQVFNETLTPLVADMSGFTEQESRYNTLKAGVSTSTNGKDIAFGGKWVTSAEQSAADSALSTARSAVESATKQSQITSAVNALKSALDTYQSAIKTATKDTSALDAAISAANSAKSGILTSDSGGSDLPGGSRYVTSAQMKALNDAITAATTAKESGENQNAIDSATNALKTATSTFNGQIKLNVSIYGVRFSGFPSSTKGTRTDQAANLGDPSPAVSTGNGSSPFDKLEPWASIKRETVSGNEMVKIPKFYYKITQNGNGVDIQIADGKMDGYSVSPAHMNRNDGKGERNYIYVGRYHTSAGYKSVSKVNPLANITRSEARTGSTGTTGFYQWDFATRFTIWLLYLVEFADFNSQAKIGGGCSTSSSIMTMGYTDSMKYHTGTTAASIGATVYGGTQYRYIEGLWDNVYDWVDGCYYNSNGLNIILNPKNFSDTANGQAAGIPSNGWAGALKVSSTGGFPLFYASNTSGGSATAGTCDNWNFYSSSPCLYVGGNYGQNTSHGLFFVYCSSTSSKGSSIGSRLLYLP